MWLEGENPVSYEIVRKKQPLCRTLIRPSNLLCVNYIKSFCFAEENFILSIMFQRLSTSVTMVTKGVLKDHLLLLGNSMTCVGTLIGFNTGGVKSLSRSLSVEVPFTDATLFVSSLPFLLSIDVNCISFKY